MTQPRAMTVDDCREAATLAPMKAPSRPPSNVVLCKSAHLAYLCERMRPDEIEQYLSLTGRTEYDAEEAARTFINMAGPKFTVLGDDHLPVAAGGYSQVMPGVWQSWMVGTMDGWGKHWRSMTKATRWLMAGMFDIGARRLQTNVLAKRRKAIQWYRRALGLEKEGRLRAMGMNGEDVLVFSKVQR